MREFLWELGAGVLVRGGQDWLRRFKARLSCGDVPGYFAVHVGKVQPVLNEWTAARAARAGAGRRIPVGLTREEVERVRVGQGRQLEPNTVAKRAYIWADFSEWREARGISLGGCGTCTHPGLPGRVSGDDVGGDPVGSCASDRFWGSKNTVT